MGKSLDSLTKGQQVIVGVQHRELFLPPRFDPQRAVRVVGDTPVKQRLIQCIDVIGADIYLSVLLMWIKVAELEEVDLYLVPFHHQVARKIGTAEYGERQFVFIETTCHLLIAHGEFGMDGSQHFVGLVSCCCFLSGGTRFALPIGIKEKANPDQPLYHYK